MKRIANFILRIPYYDKIHQIFNFALPFIMGIVSYWGKSANMDTLSFALILFGIGVFYLLLNLPTVINISLLNLRLNPLSSILTDQTTGIKNVAIRIKTIEILLRKNRNILKVAKEIGESFCDDFLRYRSQKRGKILRSIADREKLMSDWVRYDSGSGMGKLNLRKTEEGYLINVSEPFSFDGICSSSPTQCFFCGYIQGFLKKLFSNKRVGVTLRNRGQRECEFFVKVA
jgi:hypothetical protein